MRSGALEPQFFALLLHGLGIDPKDLPGEQTDRATWPFLLKLFTSNFKSKSRAEWEDIFDGTDACVTPVLMNTELEAQGFEQRPAVALETTPSLPVSLAPGSGWASNGLVPGFGGQALLLSWAGWKLGREYKMEDNSLVKTTASRL